MDRPEDIEVSKVTGKIYVALTNNSNRGPNGQAAADEANPRNSNKHGKILEIVEDGGNHASESFIWSLPIVCGDPADSSTYFVGCDKTKVSPISCPDNLDFDAHGNLWISTYGNALVEHAGTNFNDGLFAVAVEGPERARRSSSSRTRAARSRRRRTSYRTTSRSSCPCSTPARSLARRSTSRPAPGPTATSRGRP
ncbi:alkaline phosphatase PhoX [Kribbella sp. NPDC051936]|uniref:PhoX family protein n=1 Tax=Kribbella sp. NPDC051936 TaxID=3154946 RepID=UPI003443B038